MPGSGQFVVSDGDLQIQVDSGKAGISDQYTQHFASSVEHLQTELNKHGIPVIPIDTVDEVPNQIQQAIGNRIGRQRQ